jgi:hypothetical protein
MTLLGNLRIFEKKNKAMSNRILVAVRQHWYWNDQQLIVQ